MRKIIWSSILLTTIISVSAYADNAPVVDLSDGNIQAEADSATVNTSGPVVRSVTSASTPITQNMTADQRLQRLEAQVNYLNQLNLFNKIDELQQQIQQLRGQLEVQEHEIQTLTEQQKNYYEDLNQRIGNNNIKPGINKEAKPTKEVAASNNNEQAAYQAAFTLLANKKYAEAATALKKYLKDYPDGKYASNASYWLGEVYMAQANSKLAATQFQLLISKYPLSEKLPDAMLKLAFIHADTGNTQQAIKELKIIQNKFPKSGAARLAGLRLKELGNKK